MNGNISLVFFLVLLKDSVHGMCTAKGKDVFRICEKSSAEFEAIKGKMLIGPDDASALNMCTCTVQIVNLHSADFVLVATGAWNSEEIPVNFSITHGNKTLTDRSSDVIFTTTINGSDEVTLVIQRRRERSTRDVNHQYCFGFSQIKETHNLSIMCKASFEPEPEPPQEESGASLGAILGPTITVFILVDIAVIGVVYYIMKRRVNTSARWRPTIEHTVNHMKDTSVTVDNPGHGGNNYVGYRSKPQTGGRPEQPVGDEYEDVGRPRVTPQNTNLEILLPQKKPKSWFFFKKNRGSVYSQTKDVQKGEEYEDVQTSQVETAKKHLMQSPGNFQPECYENVNKLGDQFGRQKNQAKKLDVTGGESVAMGSRTGNQGKEDLQTSSDVDWTPADAYEEVHVKTKKPAAVKKPNDGFVPKDSYETMEDLKSAQHQRSKRQLEKKVGTIEGSLKPTESYEDMHPPVQRQANTRVQKTQGGSEKLKTDTEKPKTIAKSTSFKIPQSQGQMPNTTYDNMESWTKHQQKSGEGRRKVSTPKPSTQETETQSVRPTEDYDNIEMYAKQSTSRPRGISENQGVTKQPSQRRQRTQTDPQAPSQAYDNFDHIAELRRLARSESKRANVKKT